MKLLGQLLLLRPDEILQDAYTIPFHFGILFPLRSICRLQALSLPDVVELWVLCEYEEQDARLPCHSILFPILPYGCLRPSSFDRGLLVFDVSDLKCRTYPAFPLRDDPEA